MIRLAVLGPVIVIVGLLIFLGSFNFSLLVCSRVKNHSPSLPSLPCLSKLERLLSGKKNPIFPPSPPFPLLSGSLEHSISRGVQKQGFGRNRTAYFFKGKPVRVIY
ncbi:hypothetical protein Hanom_Chr02g00115371 [Helianthus anomalus]